MFERPVLFYKNKFEEVIKLIDPKTFEEFMKDLIRKHSRQDVKSVDGRFGDDGVDLYLSKKAVYQCYSPETTNGLDKKIREKFNKDFDKLKNQGFGKIYFVINDRRAGFHKDLVKEKHSLEYNGEIVIFDSDFLIQMFSDLDHLDQDFILSKYSNTHVSMIRPNEADKKFKSDLQLILNFGISSDGMSFNSYFHNIFNYYSLDDLFLYKKYYTKYETISTEMSIFFYGKGCRELLKKYGVKLKLDQGIYFPHYVPSNFIRFEEYSGCHTYLFSKRATGYHTIEYSNQNKLLNEIRAKAEHFNRELTKIINEMNQET